MSLSEVEFSALRATIATRGTVRIALVPFTFATWAAIGSVLLVSSTLPVAALFPLAVLAAGFEAIHALHVGVERIGRYLQVFYEEETAQDARMNSAINTARWETTAMAGSPALPGGGVDPLFVTLFSCAILLNLILALLPGATTPEAAVVGGLHLGMLARIVRARLAAAKQRAKDLAHYRALRSRAQGSGDRAQQEKA